MTRRHVALALSAAAFACRDPIEAPPDARFRIEPAAQWSGGWVRVHSPALATADTTVVTVVGDTVSLETSRVADTTLAVRLPDMSGSLQLRVQLGRWPFLLEPITVYGYTGARRIPVLMDEDLLVWPRNGHANVLAGTPDGVVLLQANTGHVGTFPGTGRYDSDRARGPGMTYQAGVFVLAQNGIAPLELWRLLPSAERVAVDSHLSNSRQAMQLNPRTWLLTAHHHMDLFTWSDSLGRYDLRWSIRAEESEGVVMSPRGDRATVLVDQIFEGDGVPVFDAPAGIEAYRVPGMRRVAGADFSADGERLALVGGRRSPGAAADTNQLMLLGAATGGVVWDTLLDRYAFGVTLDAFASLMYVGIMSGQSTPGVLVYARDSGTLLAELRPPASAPGCGGICYKAVIARSAEPALYVVWGYQGETWVWRFAMLPAVLTEGGGETSALGLRTTGQIPRMGPG